MFQVKKCTNKFMFVLVSASDVLIYVLQIYSGTLFYLCRFTLLKQTYIGTLFYLCTLLVLKQIYRNKPPKKLATEVRKRLYMYASTVQDVVCFFYWSCSMKHVYKYMTVRVPPGSSTWVMLRACARSLAKLDWRLIFGTSGFDLLSYSESFLPVAWGTTGSLLCKR